MKNFDERVRELEKRQTSSLSGAIQKTSEILSILNEALDARITKFPGRARTVRQQILFYKDRLNKFK